MGYYTEYLEMKFDAQGLAKERKLQLARISALRGGRDVLVYAADIDKQDISPALLSIAYNDLVPFNDQLSYLETKKVDVILETGGGSGEVAEDMVRSLHEKFEEVAFIIPGWAKSAGTIIAMAGDEILMEPSSALGPIDAQLSRQGKVFSADALIEGMEKIKKEVEESGNLNRAYIPILQAISPGELQSAENALTFAKRLVQDWLARYKFKNWQLHDGDPARPVTPDERDARAAEIAEKLCNHRDWLTHGRSIKMEDLERMNLRITDYSKQQELAEAIRRYHTLAQMTFDATPIYKIFETQRSQILRFTNVISAPSAAEGAEAAIIEIACPKCKTVSKVQANLKKGPIQPGHIPFPASNLFRCPNCHNGIDIAAQRQKIERSAGKPIVN